MKKFIMMSIALVGFVLASNAQNVPFAYDGTIEFAKLDSGMQKTLLSYANAGKYNSEVKIEADSVLQTTMVKAVKSRSGKVEDQVWMQVQVKGKTVNYLFALNKLPTIVKDACGKLTISAHRGDSNAIDGIALARNPW